jgi:hypothetical protein
VAWSEGRAVKVLTLADRTPALEVEEPLVTARLRFVGDVLVGAQEATLVRWPLVAGGARAVVTLADARRPIRELRMLPRGLVAVTRPEREGLVVWDGETGQALAEIETGCPCEMHALSANGCVAACACADVTEVRWRTLSGPAFPGCP